MYQLLIATVAASIIVGCSLNTAVHARRFQTTRNLSCQNRSINNTHFENIRNSTQVIFSKCATKQRFELTSDVFISDVNDLRIKGDKTRINCAKANISISFEKVSNLRLESLRIINCGVDYKTAFRTGGLNIVNCNNVTVTKVTIEMSPRTGLTLVNNTGVVKIEKCTFDRCGQLWKKSKRVITFQPTENSFNEFHARGGGMQVLVGRGQGNSFLIISYCQFLHNSASHGGGLFLMIQKDALQQKISILKTSFAHNNCHHGGGGLQIIFNFQDSIHAHVETSTNITAMIDIQGSTFSSNKANYGGGVSIFSALSPFLLPPGILTFTKCSWENNLAVLGLAVDITIALDDTYAMQRHLPSPAFNDCKFIKNIDRSLLRLPVIVNKPRSAFLVTGFKVEFSGTTVFRHNLGSAIEATSAVLNFQPNSTAHFIENRGIEGAGWNLQATTVYVHDNSFFLFKNNRATYSGGAIFAQYADKHSLFLSHSCFIQHVGEQSGPKNLTFVFKNNTAADYSEWSPPRHLLNLRHRGDSIWVTSLLPCISKSLSTKPSHISCALQCLGNVTFDGLDTERRQISTAADHFANTNIAANDDKWCSVLVNNTNGMITKNIKYEPITKTSSSLIEGALHFIPGKITNVPLRLVDDLCAEIFFRVQVKVIRSEKYMYIHSAHSVITDNRLTLYGDENQSGRIQLTTLGIRAITATINVSMDECPPGFVHNRTTRACVCSVNTNSSEYLGIVRCSESAAFVQHGYWVGYLNIANSTRENRLATTLCPKGFCSNSTKSTNEHKLPFNASGDISISVCSAHRTGLVCGICRENYSVYYHSGSFNCKSSDLCHLGWLFYILSELIPVTLLFLLIIVLNISFTSGPLNGVIFFVQYVDTLKIKGENFLWFESSIQKLTFIYKIVYRVFSLRFFSVEPLSFCLWSGASALDLLAFRYSTITYSLLLIIGTVALFKVCNFKLCGRFDINVKGSIIHGLSAFLVMSYSECTRVSLMIISRGTLRVGPNNHLDDRYFAFYHGEYSYMGPEHLKYALPALFFIVTLVSIPPLLLISYPLCYKLLALLRLEESKCLYFSCKIIPLERIKPLFDSIQSAFKDHYRFFAGLYFIYRLSSLLTFSITRSLTVYYTLTGIQLVFMLTIHAACRPYKKPWHNVLDSSLFFNLFVINGLAFYNYCLTSITHENNKINQVITFLQTGLILLPLVYLIGYTLYCLVRKLKTVCTHCSDFQQVDTGHGSNDALILHAIDSRSTEESEAFPDPSNYKLIAGRMQ